MLPSSRVPLVIFLLSILSPPLNAQLNSYDCWAGRDAVVHLFEWKYTDIQRECAWLGTKGYCAVQISPPQEHIIIDPACPWWVRYQPVSYALTSRGGSEAQLASMVAACNDLGIRIYVDTVINHMTGGGSGTGTAGNFWNAGGSSSVNWGGQQYPGVPFGENDFHRPGNGDRDCPTGSMEIENFGDVKQVRNCRLVGLRDLAMLNGYVRDRIVLDYMNRLIDLGVAGFRVDAAKHMWPEDLQNIYGRLNDLSTNWFSSGTRPYVFQEVIDMGGDVIPSNSYTYLGRVTEFKYGDKLSEVVLKANGQRLAYLVNFGEPWGFLGRFDAFAFVDNHDTQRSHANILNYKRPREYKIAVAFMLAWDYAHVRVMSSYAFDFSDQSPPSGANCQTQDVVCQMDGGPWVCEHRWRPIYNMVRLHATAIGQGVQNWWDNGFQAISFSRGARAFVAINNEDFEVSRTFQTGLPAGDYCNVILCDNNRPPCSGAGGCAVVTVAGDGTAAISIPNSSDPIVALHV